LLLQKRDSAGYPVRFKERGGGMKQTLLVALAVDATGKEEALLIVFKICSQGMGG